MHLSPNKAPSWHPHPQFQGPRVPYLVALAVRNGSSAEPAGKVGSVIKVRGRADVGEVKDSSLACPFCTFKMLEGVGRRPEFSFCLSAWILA